MGFSPAGNSDLLPAVPALLPVECPPPVPALEPCPAEPDEEEPLDPPADVPVLDEPVPTADPLAADPAAAEDVEPEDAAEGGTADGALAVLAFWTFAVEVVALAFFLVAVVFAGGVAFLGVLGVAVLATIGVVWVAAVVVCVLEAGGISELPVSWSSPVTFVARNAITAMSMTTITTAPMMWSPRSRRGAGIGTDFRMPWSLAVVVGSTGDGTGGAGAASRRSSTTAGSATGAAFVVLVESSGSWSTGGAPAPWPVGRSRRSAR
jgi:hypothetical protein